ncbi:MAG: hypothetical protein ABI335_25695 [Polyangiaceae bacterium]
MTPAFASASATSATPPAPSHAVRRLFDGPCVELDDGQIVCSTEDDAQGCRFEPVRAGSVAPMGDSLCALSLSGQALSLHGLGCDWDAKAERFVPPLLKGQMFSCRHELDASVSCFLEGKPPRTMLKQVRMLGGGVGFFCALRVKGDVWCWGENDEGGLGDGHSYRTERPVRVKLWQTADEIAVGSQHACARFGNGVVVCWGEHSRGQLGIGHLPSPGDIPEPGSPAEYLNPQTVQALPPVASIQALGAETCALTRSGEVYCWGELWDAQRRDAVPVASPRLLTGLPRVEELELGTTSCARSGGEVFCWGDACPFTQIGEFVDRPTRVEWAVSP